MARVLDIIKRYIAYYYFLFLAYHYSGTIKEFRNNLIQYSKLQENSPLTIRNFFDTENNYQIIYFYKLIKDISQLVLMTSLQKETVNKLQMKDAIDFIDQLGPDYIDNYILTISPQEDNPSEVAVNVHNLIKTIVFGEIYRNQEQNLVFALLNDIEESEHEYIFIDIVVTDEDQLSVEVLRQLFIGNPDQDSIADQIYRLINDSQRIPTTLTSEEKNEKLLRFKITYPIVDDFLRYHRDTERIETEMNSSFTIPIVGTNNIKNVQMALLYQQRKKNENTKAHIIVNKIDVISNYYSNNVRSQPQLIEEIKKYFQGPLDYRKAIPHNYLDEVYVMNKIVNQGRKVIENNEYFLSLRKIVHTAYFNFEDFKKYGTHVNLYHGKPIDMVRYSNIEFQKHMPHLYIDMHTGTENSTINMVGMLIDPFHGTNPMQCTHKENLVNISGIKLNYRKNGEVINFQSDNGYEAFMKMIKYFYIDTIRVRRRERVNEYTFYHDNRAMRALNPDLVGKILYWIYDIEKDTFKIDTYENTKSYNFQETIRYMNALIHDKIEKAFRRKLSSLLVDNSDLPLSEIERLVELFDKTHMLQMSPDEKQLFVTKDYLQLKVIGEATIAMPTKELTPVIYQPSQKIVSRKITVDMINPNHLQPYRRLEAYTKNELNEQGIHINNYRCQHEDEWNSLKKFRKENLNKYNAAVTEFMDKYALEISNLDFICKVCGQVLPLKKFVQDGSYNNITQKFVTAYSPIDIPLEDIKEYSKYPYSIKYLDSLINRVSFITGTSMLIGPASHVKQKRKALVKNILDIVLKHNSVNLAKKSNDKARQTFFADKFNVDKQLDIVYFFEMSDSIFDFSLTLTELDQKSNKLKYNNILLYFILIFMTEISGSQIALMSFDKIANIYVYLKYGPKLFSDLRIKKNINGLETAPITDYPVLCYLIFVLAYFLIRHNIWINQGANNKAFNPVFQKIIINSIVDLFNSIAMDAATMPHDYAYLLTTSKLFTQLNGLFKNNSVINALKRNHAKYSGNPEIVPAKNAEEVTTYPITIYKEIVVMKRLPNVKDDGINFELPDELVYPATIINSDISNCPQGTYHEWEVNVTNGNITCKICGETITQVTGAIDRTVDVYYHNLQEIAKRRCIQGTFHNFENVNGEQICTICGHKPGDIYTREELDQLASNLDKIEDEHAESQINQNITEEQKLHNHELAGEEIRDEWINRFEKEGHNKLYDGAVTLIDKLMVKIEGLIGIGSDLGIDKYPMYLNDNVYIIDHSYNGTPYNEPIIFTDKDNRLELQENHPYFKMDVYYYVDKRLEITVYYDAVSLKLLGYKEKHKGYVTVNKLNTYLKINNSIKNQLLIIGYPSQYINIDTMFQKGTALNTDANIAFYNILDNLIKSHILNMKAIVDKFISILFKIKNYQPSEITEETSALLASAKSLDILVTKYARTFDEKSKETLDIIEDKFVDWNFLRDEFNFQPVKWSDTNVIRNETQYVNSNLISYYDAAGNLMLSYLITELINILDSAKENTDKTSIAQMYIGIITYIYRLYNTDAYKNSPDLKRFEHIINGSGEMEQALRRGKGVVSEPIILENPEQDISNAVELGVETENQLEEIEDLREEVEALDIENDYFAEEDEDLALGNEE